MGENVIRIRGLRKRYRGTDRPAVDGVDLDVGRGEVVALLGPNGAGKTTTVEILEGYRNRDGGEVTVLGSDPAAADRAWRARIGIVLQLAIDMTELRPAEVVREFAGYYPHPLDPDEVLRRVGLWEQRRTFVRDLSGGSAGGSTWRWASSDVPTCSSSTSRPPVSTRRRAATSGS